MVFSDDPMERDDSPTTVKTYRNRQASMNMTNRTYKVPVSLRSSRYTDQ